MSNHKLSLTPIINIELFYQKATFPGVNSSPYSQQNFKYVFKCAIFNASHKQENPKRISFLSVANVGMIEISK